MARLKHDANAHAQELIDRSFDEVQDLIEVLGVIAHAQRMGARIEKHDKERVTKLLKTLRRDIGESLVVYSP